MKNYHPVGSDSYQLYNISVGMIQKRSQVWVKKPNENYLPISVFTIYHSVWCLIYSNLRIQCIIIWSPPRYRPVVNFFENAAVRDQDFYLNNLRRKSKQRHKTGRKGEKVYSNSAYRNHKFILRFFQDFKCCVWSSFWQSQLLQQLQFCIIYSRITNKNTNEMANKVLSFFNWRMDNSQLSIIRILNKFNYVPIQNVKI